MRSEDLIERLGGGPPRPERHGFAKRLAAGLGLGWLGTLVLVVLILGPREDLGLAIRGHAFWVKLLYCASIASLATLAVARLARPEGLPMRWLWLLALPLLAMAGDGVMELARAAPDQRLDLWLGDSWKVCSALVFVLSVPVFGGLLLAFRWLAPTRLTAAGAAAGLTSGGWAATLYCLHCPETGASFVATWYTLGIALATGAGALLGPRLLRW